MTIHHVEEISAWRSREAYNLLAQTGYSLQGLIQSCPALESFDLQLEISLKLKLYEPCLNLSFTNSSSLKEIRLAIFHHCRYFALNGDRRYDSDEDRCMEYNERLDVLSASDNTINTDVNPTKEPFHVNLVHNDRCPIAAVLALSDLTIRCTRRP